MPGKNDARHHAGHMAHQSGMSAEASVERVYLDLGYTIVARRWRGAAGEIDLVLRTGVTLVFVEVKKSRSFAQAAARVSASQQRRILAAATEFVSDRPSGQLSPMRFDVALCNGAGEMEIIENALTSDR